MRCQKLPNLNFLEISLNRSVLEKNFLNCPIKLLAIATLKLDTDNFLNCINWQGRIVFHCIQVLAISDCRKLQFGFKQGNSRIVANWFHYYAAEYRR